MADVYRREERMANLQSNLNKHAVQRKPLQDCTNEELMMILEQQNQIYSNLNLRNSLPDKGKKIEQKIEEIKKLLQANSGQMQLRYFLPSDTSDKTSVASSKPFEPDLTIVEKAEEMTLNDTSADSSVDKDIDTIHDKLHFMSLKDQELQNRDPRKEELAQIVQKGRLGILYEQKNNKVGRKIALLPMDESISLTEKDFEENKREIQPTSSEFTVQTSQVTEHYEEDEELLDEDIVDLGEQDQW